jgi:hypothetical protein
MCGQLVQQTVEHDGDRTYRCGCQVFRCSNLGTAFNDHDSPNDPNVTWACCGHPAPTLPCPLGALHLHAEPDWSVVVAQVLAGAKPTPAGRYEGALDGPASWLAWLGLYLADTPYADALGRAVAARFQDSDPQVRGRVLLFFEQHPALDGIEQLFAEATAHPESVVVGYPVPEGRFIPTLWRVLVERLCRIADRTSPTSRLAEEAVRRAVVVPLAQLVREERGPYDFIGERRRAAVEHSAHRGTLLTPSELQTLDEHEDLQRRLRADPIRHSFEIEWEQDAFNSPGLARFVAEQILAIDAAAPGRWRGILSLLSSWTLRAEPFALLAGTLLVTRGGVCREELQEFIDQRRRRGKTVESAWAEPVLEAASPRSPA